jgi:arylsulfatase A-like enzyme
MPSVGFTYAQDNNGDRSDVSPQITRPPMSHYLRELGYETLYAGKWHLGNRNIQKWFDWHAACDQSERDYSEWCRLHGVPDGFVFHDPERSRPFRSKHAPNMSLPATGILDIPEDKEHNWWVLSHAFELFALRDRALPYFAVLSFEGPHPPLVVPERYYDMYDPASLREPDNWNANVREPSFLDQCYYRQLRHEWGDNFDAWRKSIAVYWGYATYIDSLFGRYLDRLRELGALDNTLVVMMSDHGDLLGQHKLSQKMCPYEEALLIPSVFSWPGVIEPGVRIGMDASVIDIAPTVLAAAGMDPSPLKLEGENLLPYLTRQKPEPPHRDCFAEYTMSSFQEQWQGVEDWRCMGRRRWKYVTPRNGEAVLFTLRVDPSARANLADTPDVHEVEATLRQALLAWSNKVDPDFAQGVLEVNRA